MGRGFLFVANLLLLGPLLLLLVDCAQDSGFDEEVGGGGSSQIVLKLEQSFDEGRSFSSRGSLTIHSLRSGASSVDSIDNFNEAEKLALIKLCKSDRLYLMRAIHYDEDKSVKVHRTATHACNLVRSALADVLTVQLDWRHKVVAVSLSTSLDTVGDKRKQKDTEFIEEHEQDDDKLSKVTGFRTKAYVQHMESGPTPDTASFIHKMEQEKLAKQRGETKDNKSFFAKYWMYIIPVVLVVAMSSSGNQDGGAR